MRKLDIIANILLIVGGIVWGLVGFFNFNVVTYVVVEPWLERVIYILFGAAAIFELFCWKSHKKRK